MRLPQYLSLTPDRMYSAAYNNLWKTDSQDRYASGGYGGQRGSFFHCFLPIYVLGEKQILQEDRNAEDDFPRDVCDLACSAVRTPPVGPGGDGHRSRDLPWMPRRQDRRRSFRRIRSRQERLQQLPYPADRPLSARERHHQDGEGPVRALPQEGKRRALRQRAYTKGREMRRLPHRYTHAPLLEK